MSYKLVITQSEKYKSEISSLKVKMSEDSSKFEELQYMEEEISRLSQMLLNKQKEVDSWTKKYSEL